MSSSGPIPADILSYWFGPDSDDPVAVNSAQAPLWWGKSDETDREITERFAPTLEQGGRGELDAWTETPEGTLALIIVLDQFSRVIHRGNAGMFAQDQRAQGLTARLIEEGGDEKLAAIRRVFAYMPLMHSEDINRQELGVERFAAMAAAQPEGSRGPFDNTAKFAVMHRDIVAKFARFPHRNEALGRNSTQAELEFLAGPNSSF